MGLFMYSLALELVWVFVNRRKEGEKRKKLKRTQNDTKKKGLMYGKL